MPRQVLIFALLLASVPLPGAAMALAQNEAAQKSKVLAAKTENEAGQAAVRLRKQVTDAKLAALVVRKVKFDQVVGLVLGQYLENGPFQGDQTVAALRIFAARRGQFGKAATMAAWSPPMAKIVETLGESRSERDRVLAATILATYAFSLSHEDGGGRGATSGSASRAGTRQPARQQAKKAKANRAARQKGIPRSNIGPMVDKMLDDKSRDVLELAVLAAAYARLADVAEKIEKINASGSIDLEGARLFYRARTGGPLDENLVRRGLSARMKLEKRWRQLSRHLNSYEIRGNGLLYTLQAIAHTGDGRFTAQLHKLLDHADIRVRMEAATAIEHAGDLSSAPVLLKQLESNPPWPVKVRLLSAIGAVPDKASINPLIDMFRQEKGRFRQDVGYALASITAGRHGKNIYDIYIWWQENEEKFTVDVAATRRYRQKTRLQDIKVNSLTTFYGLPIISDRVVFVLDTSASMKGEKIADLKSHMQDVLKDLPKHFLFNIVDFGGVINILRPGAMIEARYQYKVGELINDLSLTYGTRTFDAMEKAAELPRMDTIAYLSDGAPVGGQFNAWPRIVRTMDLYHRYRPIAVHTVHFRAGKGGGGKGPARTGTARWMKELADRNAGWFTDSKDAGDAGDENQ